MRRKKLGHRGNILVGHRALAGHHLIFPLRNAELEQPAQHLDLGAILIADLSPKAVNDGMRGEQIIGQQQLGLVIQRLEQKRHQPVIKPAGGQHQMLIRPRPVDRVTADDRRATG